MMGPIYLMDDTRHHYSEVFKNVDELKTLTGPVFNIDNKHCYVEIIKNVEKIEKLMGPVFDVEHRSTYNALKEKAEVLKELHGMCIIILLKKFFDNPCNQNLAFFFKRSHL